MSRALLTGIVLCLALAPAAAARKPVAYHVKLTFTQTRPWTYHYVQSSPDCVRTDSGNGIDVVKVTSKSDIGAGPRAATGFGALAHDHRTGTMTHNVSGAECAPSAVFPSTWSTVTETDGSVTATEDHSGCGDKIATKVSFMTVTLKGSALKLKWDSAVAPEFDPCPDFEGSNDPSPGHELPGIAFRNLSVKVNRAAFRRGSRRIVATHTSKRSAVENCSNLTQGCAEGVSYEATATVTTTLKLVLTRKRG
jgi:hypothetical protein